MRIDLVKVDPVCTTRCGCCCKIAKTISVEVILWSKRLILFNTKCSRLYRNMSWWAVVLKLYLLWVIPGRLSMCVHLFVWATCACVGTDQACVHMWMQESTTYTLGPNISEKPFFWCWSTSITSGIIQQKNLISQTLFQLETRSSWFRTDSHLIPNCAKLLLAMWSMTIMRGYTEKNLNSLSHRFTHVQHTSLKKKKSVKETSTRSFLSSFARWLHSYPWLL